MSPTRHFLTFSYFFPYTLIYENSYVTVATLKIFKNIDSILDNIGRTAFLETVSPYCISVNQKLYIIITV
jgi:hypothetical protein